MSERQIEIIVRGIMLQDGQVLCVRRKGAENIFLPGGHIEHGESAEEALKREIQEELGIDSRITGFLGAVEHGFANDDGYTQEMNLVFSFEGEGMHAGEDPPPAENHLEFMWLSADKDTLAHHNMQPWILREGLAGLGAGRQFPRFGSTIHRER